MQKTQNFSLNKPEAADPIRVSDFNENADKIDAVLNALNTAVTDLSAERIYIGSYVGNGTTSRTIQLPWTPKFVLLLGHYNSSGVLSVLLQGFTFFYYSDSWYTTETGSSNILLSGSTLVIKDDYRNNVADKTVRYILLR